MIDIAGMMSIKNVIERKGGMRRKLIETEEEKVSYRLLLIAPHQANPSDSSSHRTP
jgi:hypothetical protein